MDSATLNFLVLLATAATAIFTGWAVWQRWRYTPRPHWLVPTIRQSSDPQDITENGNVEYQFANRGDATAMDVRLSTRVDGSWVESKTYPMIAPGDDARFWLEVPATFPGHWDPRTGKREHPLIWTWTPTKARITWRQHPRLARVKSKSFDLPQPVDEAI